MSINKTYHYNQGAKPHALSNSDYLLLTQSVPTNLSGYQSGNATIQMVVDMLYPVLKADATRILKFDNTRGISGTGSTTSPASIDTNYVNNAWVVAKYAGVSQIGDMSLTSLPFSTSGLRINVTADIPVFLGGITTLIANGTILDLSAAPSSVLYIYLSIVNGAASLSYSQTPRAESFTSTFIGKVTTTTNAINSFSFVPFQRVGNARLSNISIGGAIPANQNDPSVKQYQTWGGTGNDTVLAVGVDITRYTGTVSFDPTNENINIQGSGTFFIRDLASTLLYVDRFYVTHIWGTAYNGVCTINGNQIWSGIGDNWDTRDISAYLVEGVNTVTFTTGGLTIKAPLIKV